jgi:predicted Rossmann fold flavoprotein
MREFDLIVIGGGPAGMMAAGTAARRGVKVALIEKMEKLGRKLRITGKGRCNLTNSKTQEEILEKVRANAEFFSHSLKEFSNMDTIDFFERNGLEISIERGGRVFPASGKAWDVADCLKEWIEESGVSIFYNSKVCAIERNGSIGYKLIVTEKSETWSYYCKKIIIATGGVSYPATGSTGDGYLLANRMGHRIEEVRPALVALETDKKYLPELKRLELKAVDNNASGVTYGKMTVSGHKGIEEIVFPKETKSIEGGAIEKCPNLKVAYIPAGVTVSKSAFTGVHADFEIVYTE